MYSLVFIYLLCFTYSLLFGGTVDRFSASWTVRVLVLNIQHT